MVSRVVHGDSIFFGWFFRLLLLKKLEKNHAYRHDRNLNQLSGVLFAGHKSRSPYTPRRGLSYRRFLKCVCDMDKVPADDTFFSIVRLMSSAGCPFRYQFFINNSGVLFAIIFMKN